jgi:hypothetical protein
LKTKAITYTAALALSFALCAIVFACRKKSDPKYEKATVQIRMTDAPGPYDEVNIDLQGVEVTGQGGAVMLNVNPGTYNLLKFSNGLDTLIATGGLEPGRVQQLRLILGNNNSLKIGNTIHPLATPSAQQSGLKLQIHHTLEAGVAYSLLLDFDAYKSVVQEGNGTYSLKPVIRVIATAVSGAIKGKINPAVNAVVTADGGGHSFSSAPNASGDFILKGLPPGTYTVAILPAAPTGSASVGNVQVNIGNTTDIGTINL